MLPELKYDMNKRGCTVGQTNRVSLTDMPDEHLAEALNAILIFMVVLESLRTASMGNRNTWCYGFSKSEGGIV